MTNKKTEQPVAEAEGNSKIVAGDVTSTIEVVAAGSETPDGSVNEAESGKSEPACSSKDDSDLKDQSVISLKFPLEDSLNIERGEFLVKSDGSYINIKDDTGKSHPLRLFNTLLVGPRFRNKNRTCWQVLVSFIALDGEEVELLISLADLGTDQFKVMKDLLAHGLEFEASKEMGGIIARYISVFQSAKFGMVSDQNGWADEAFDAFVLGGTVLSTEDKIVRPVRHLSDSIRFCRSGSEQDWISNVGELCKGNHWLIYALAHGLTGPLAPMLEMQAPGIHVYGRSRKGKSTLAKFICGLWGNPRNRKFLTSWNATIVGIELHASAANNNVICLDEVGEATAKEVYNTTYMIFNGTPRSRASDSATKRASVPWNAAFFSTGEVSIEDKLLEGRRAMKPGQEVRVPSVPIECRKKLPVFEDKHGQSNTKQFVDVLTDRVHNNFGTIGPAFVAKLMEDQEGCVALALKVKQRFIQEVKSLFDSGIEAPVADSFGLVAAAGVVAADRLGLNWSEDDVIEAVKAIFTRWHEAFEFDDLDPDEKTLQIIGGLLQANREKFKGVDEYRKYYRESVGKWGYIRWEKPSNYFYIFPHSFSEEICTRNNINPTKAWKLLRERGFLKTQNTDEGVVKVKFDNTGSNERYYAIPDKLFVSDKAEMSHPKAKKKLPSEISAPSSSKETDDAVESDQSSSEIDKAIVGSAPVKTSAADLLEKSRQRRESAQDSCTSDKIEMAATPSIECNESADDEGVRRVDDSIFG